MAVSNKVAGIIVGNMVGPRPSLVFDKAKNRYVLDVMVSNTVIDRIFADGRRNGFDIYRETIEDFITGLLESGNVSAMIHGDSIYADNEILAGERLRINGFDGVYVDLLKIDSRRYICTDGTLAGDILEFPSNAIDVSVFDPAFSMSSMAMLIPSNTHYMLDYKYLNTYRTRVADSIADIYDAVSLAFSNGSLCSDFGRIVSMCSASGLSFWTLRGLVDFMQLRYNG